MSKKEKWFKPKKKTGWKKSQKASIRRNKLLSSTPKNKKIRDRYIEAGRRAQALTNVTKDKPTKIKAKTDANYFFKKAKVKKR